MKAFLVHKPGPFTTIQDAGRPNLRRFGIPISGALDQFAYHLANALVGNRPTAAALEVTLCGLVLEALSPLVVAVTGADLGAQRNHEPLPLWQSVALDRGDRLSFPKRIHGCRAYLAVRGGFDAPEFLSSKSTFTKGRMGAPLKAGDTLSMGQLLHPIPPPLRRLLPQLRPTPSAEQSVRVILGPQTEYFTARGLETFRQSTYSISPKSDRQGFRTEGPPIEIAKGPDIISDPTPLGAVQIPGDGQPIILHRDGQSTGGYAKIAKVIDADLDKFGQLIPGDKIRFEVVTREDAVAFLSDYQQRLRILTAMVEA